MKTHVISSIHQNISHDIIEESLKNRKRIIRKKVKCNNVNIEETYKYDENGNLVEFASTEGYHETMKYDDRGNMIYYNDGIVKETYEYDEYNHIIKHTSTEVFENENRMPMTQETTVEYEYDDIGNLLRWFSSEGDECVMKYDTDNNLIYYCLSGTSYDENIEEWYEYE